MSSRGRSILPTRRIVIASDLVVITVLVVVLVSVHVVVVVAVVVVVVVTSCARDHSSCAWVLILSCKGLALCFSSFLNGLVVSQQPKRNKEEDQKDAVGVLVNSPLSTTNHSNQQDRCEPGTHNDKCAKKILVAIVRVLRLLFFLPSHNRRHHSFFSQRADRRNWKPTVNSNINIIWSQIRTEWRFQKRVKLSPY